MKGVGAGVFERRIDFGPGYRIYFGKDGDTLVILPEVDGEVDTDLWGAHMQIVQQAQANRAEFLRTVVSAASNLGSFLKP